MTWVMTERDSVELIEMFSSSGDRHLLVAAQHLADAVINDDGIVQRIAENGQQRCDAGQVELDQRDRR